jgi:hypothetical protein
MKTCFFHLTAAATFYIRIPPSENLSLCFAKSTSSIPLLTDLDLRTFLLLFFFMNYRPSALVHFANKPSGGFEPRQELITTVSISDFSTVLIGRVFFNAGYL